MEIPDSLTADQSGSRAEGTYDVSISESLVGHSRSGAEGTEGMEQNWLSPDRGWCWDVCWVIVSVTSATSVIIIRWS
jgi:hypothetical protein